MRTLENNGVNAALQHYPGLGHGPMFNASFRSALLDISREPASQNHAAINLPLEYAASGGIIHQNEAVTPA